MQIIDVTDSITLKKDYPTEHPAYTRADHDACANNTNSDYYEWVYKEIFIEANGESAWLVLQHVKECIKQHYPNIKNLATNTPLRPLLAQTHRKYQLFTEDIMQHDITPFNAAHFLRAEMMYIHNFTLFHLVSAAVQILMREEINSIY